MMPPDPLRGPKSKIKGAKRNISDLEREIATWIESDPYVLRVDTDVQAGKDIYRLYKGAEIPDTIKVNLGQFLHNARSALDQLVCACASASGHSSVSDVYFIIGRGPDVFEDKRFKATIKKLPPRAVTFMRRLKPYKGGNDLLYALHTLNKTDKHNILVPVVSGGLMGVRPPRTPPGEPVTLKVPFGPWCPIEDGFDLLTIRAGAKVEGEFGLSTTVAFGDVETVCWQPVAAVCNQLVDLVERIVGIFERHFF